MVIISILLAITAVQQALLYVGGGILGLLILYWLVRIGGLDLVFLVLEFLAEIIIGLFC